VTRRAERGATLFFAFPFEALPAQERPLALERAVGWLSWLGRSSLEAEPSSVEPGERVTYTLTLHNDGLGTVTASVSNTMPADVDVVPDTFAGPGIYDPVEDRLSWQGAIGPDETLTFRYQACIVADTTRGESVVNAARILLEDHDIGFERRATVGVSVPDLSASTFGCEPEAVRPGRWSTCTLSLRNGGPVDAQRATARIYPPGQFAPNEGSLWASEGAADWTGDVIAWSGPLAASSTATLTFKLQGPSEPVPRMLYGVAFLGDDVGGSWERPEWLRVHPWEAYLPIVRRAE
jgi:uncharacterized repeat protein (TIGR01451 family)